MRSFRPQLLRGAALPAAAVVLLLGAVSCSSGGSSSDEGTQASPTTQTSQSSSTTATQDAPSGSAQASGQGDFAPSAALVAAAKKEGAVTWYAAIPTAQRAVDAFTKEYGIKVSLLRETSGQVATRFSNEAKAGSNAADVVLQSDATFAATAFENKWTRELTADYIPILSQYPKQYVHPGYIDSVVIPWGMDVNTQCLESKGVPMLTSYKDLVNPKLKGEILLSDPRQSAVTAANEYYIYKHYGDDFMKQLGQQDLKVFDSQVPALQQLAAGAGCVVLQSIPSQDASLIAAGAPLKYVLPDETSAFAQVVSVSANPPHPNAAQLFAQFLLSPGAGQDALAVDTGVAPLGNVEGAIKLPAKLEFIDTAVAQANLSTISNLLNLHS